MLSPLSLAIIAAIHAAPEPFTVGQIMAAVAPQFPAAQVDLNSIRDVVNILQRKYHAVQTAVPSCGKTMAQYVRRPQAFAARLKQIETESASTRYRHAGPLHDQMRSLRDQGLTYRAIADQTGLTLNQVTSALLSRHNKKSDAAIEPLDPPTTFELAWRQFRSNVLGPDDHFYSKETLIT
jgi:hypothetical protein